MTQMTRCKSNGFGLLELMVVLVIAMLLVSLSVPGYSAFTERAKIARAVGDIESLGHAIDQFRLAHDDRIPLTLGELGVDIPDDPWGLPYEFLIIDAADPGKGEFRKDGKINRLNSDFDLYSRGKDGDSKGPLNAKASRDDVVRANNGAFIGLGEDY